MTRVRRCVLTVVLCAAAAGAAAARELSLPEALAAAERSSPRLRSARFERDAAVEGVGAARSLYYPLIAAEGIDSWGFPGSSGALGIGGLAGSPFRSGEAGELVATDTLFDFGRTWSAVKTAESGEKISREQIGVDRLALDVDVLRTYYSCSRFRSEREVWDSLHGETELVAKEVARFVGTGQRSIVDKYLSQGQVEEARTNRNYFGSRAGSTLKRLELLTGLAEADLTCPALPGVEQSSPLSGSAENPYVRRAQAEVELAQSRLTGARADYLPKIVGVASVGAMEKTRLVQRTDYSGGLGIVLPLFDGLGTVRRVGRARAELEAKTQELGAVRLELDEANAKYDEIIDASRARLEHLLAEQQLAEEGFRVAKERYFKFQGTLVDLRDALRNLGRIETDMNDTKADLLEASGSKELLNGAAPPGAGSGEEGR